MKSNFKKGSKTNGIAIITIIFLLIVGLVLFFYSISFRNDRIVVKLQKTLEDTPLPERTELCDAVSKAGKLTGNGNGMQYFGGILIQSELNLDELESYYVKYRQNEWEYIVAPQNGSEIEQVEHGYMKFSYLNGKREAMENYYIVYTWGSSKNMFSDFDLRGH